MTHFVCLVIVPECERDCYEGYVESALEPYSEYTEVDPYIDVDKDDLKKEYKEHIKKRKKEKKTLEDWEKTLNSWVKEWYSGQELDEEGNLLSTSNPDSFYDWYEIGGRWDGYLTGKKGVNIMKVSELIEKFKKEEEKLNNPVEKFVKNLDGQKESYNKYLIEHLVVDGEHYFCSEVGWFGFGENTKELEEYKKDYLNLLENHKEDYAVLCDCHV